MSRIFGKIRRLIRVRAIKFILVRWLDPLFLKSNKQVLFVVKKNTVFSANHRVTCEYFLRHFKQHKIAIFAIGTMPKEIEDDLYDHGVAIYNSYSIRYLLYLWRCGILFISHSVRDAFLSAPHKHRLIVNYWHGATFKKVENRMHNLDSKKKKLIHRNSFLYNCLIASSKGDQKLMSESFGISMRKVHPIGLPRYDLFSNYQSIFNYSNTIELFFKQLYAEYEKVILYAPTFREHGTSPIVDLSYEELYLLNDYCREKNFYFLIRPHYYDNNVLQQEYSHISMIPHQIYHETNLILANVSILIVDYSSIWVDYLLTDRPIIFYCKDLELYQTNERGLNYDIDFLPGNMVRNVNDLLINLTLHDDGDPFAKRRSEVKQYFHDYDTEHSCTERLIELVEKETNDTL